MKKKKGKKKSFMYKGFLVSVVKPNWYTVQVGKTPPFFDPQKNVIKAFIDKWSKKKKKK